MSMIAIDRISKVTPCMYTKKDKTRGTVYEIQVDGTVDGRNVGTLILKTFTKSVSENISDGMEVECEQNNYNGKITYLLPKVLPGGQAPARQAASLPDSIRPAVKQATYTDGELALLLNRGIDYAVRLGKAHEIPEQYQVDLAIAWFKEASRHGIKVGQTVSPPVRQAEPEPAEEAEGHGIDMDDDQGLPF